MSETSIVVHVRHKPIIIRSNLLKSNRPHGARDYRLRKDYLINVGSPYLIQIDHSCPSSSSSKIRTKNRTFREFDHRFCILFAPISCLASLVVFVVHSIAVKYKVYRHAVAISTSSLSILLQPDDLKSFLRRIHGPPDLRSKCSRTHTFAKCPVPIKSCSS